VNEDKPVRQRTTSSIPSKFETTLHVGQRESNAFGGRTFRFSTNDNEMPGPGSYHKPPSMVRETGKCGSVSKLGFGAGFVSKTKRFSDRNDVNSAQAPGPGHYGHEKLQKNFSKLGTTGTFAQPKHVMNVACNVWIASNPVCECSFI
jgi:hypothetical protein